MTYIPLLMLYLDDLGMKSTDILHRIQHDNHIQFWMLSFLLSAVVYYTVCVRFHNGLNKIPGPFLASLSSFWKFYVVWCEDMPRRNSLLHEKFGPLVRIGPNHVSASSAEAIQTIHRAKTGFVKVISFPRSTSVIFLLRDRQSSIYGILQPRLNGQDLHNVFSTQDPEFHTALKRTIGSLYTTAAVIELEFHIDSCIQLFVSQMRDLSRERSATVDMSAWMQYYAFDTLGAINFSRKLGFLDAGADIDGICKLDHGQMMYFALVCL